MLQVSHIRENKEQVIKALAKRNLDVRELVEEVISLDEKRRNTQVELDNILAEANKLSASIGELMKSGKREEAEAMKSQTASLKERSKEIAESLDIFSNDLQQKLYLLPNTPAEIVPEGKN